MRTEVRGWFWQGRATSGAAAPASQSAARDPHAASPPDRPGFAIGGVVPMLQPDQTTRGSAATTVPPRTAPTPTMMRLCRELSRSRRHARCQRLTKRARTAMTTGTPATIGEAGAAAPLVARRCQNHPRTSVLTQRTSWYPPHLTHVLAPVVCRAARGRAADRRRVAPRGTRLSEKRAAVTQRRNFSKNSVVRRSRSGGIFRKKQSLHGDKPCRAARGRTKRPRGRRDRRAAGRARWATSGTSRPPRPCRIAAASSGRRCASLVLEG